MNTENRRNEEESGVHHLDENQKSRVVKGKVVFIKRMKTKKQSGKGKVVFIKRMKTKKQSGKGKVVFIKRMKTKKQSSKGKRGVHQADENQKAERQSKKWCSSSG